MFKRYENLSLFSKIRLIICILALTLSTIITVIVSIYYRYILSERLLGNIKAATVSAANTLNVNYTNIIERFVTTCGTEAFKRDLEYLCGKDNSNLTANSLVQEELSSLSNCNYLVHSAMILSGDRKTAYTRYNNPLYQAADTLFSEDELAQVKGITLLHERKSPFRSRGSVLPVVFPISIASQYVNLEITGNAPSVYVIIYIDSAKLQTSLNLSNTDQPQSTWYLLSAEGILLSTPLSEQKADMLTVLDDERTKQLLNSLSENASDFGIFEGFDYYLLASALHDRDIILLNYAHRESFADIFGRTGLFLFLLLMLVVLFLMIVAFLMTRYVTRPVNHLVDIVHQIERDEYHEKQEFPTQDEIGQLGSAINGMCDTINEQIARIAQEAAEKYQTQIQLMTEQINPHFLYNTLECIQSEVLRGDSNVAANMIQYLAEYLRIGLSYGANLIPISNELRHADVYIRLMNQRFQQSIMFLSRTPPDLGRLLIPKTILQPLLENSIRHGFGIDASGIPASVPTIEVSFRVSGQCLIIEVVDNGGGFDCNKVREITLGGKSGETDQHVGLHNVYRRLVTYYGEDNVRVAFRSIPYYRNEITLEIPLPEG